MNGHHLRQTFLAGKRVYGTCIEGYGQPRWPQYFAQLGLDFVFIDNEHTPLNRETMAWAAQAYAAHNIAPLVRIPDRSPDQAAMALDLGAHGVIAPYVETVEQVKALVGAVKYRPLKGAALQTILDDDTFPSEETAAYLQSFNANTLLVIMIESPAGVANLPNLLAVGGVDAVLIGPHDFSISHGIPEQYDHPTFNEAAKTIIQTCRENRVGVGIHFIAGDVERQLRWIAWGCNFVVHRSDTSFIANGIKQELGHVRQLVEGDIVTDLSDPGASGHGA